ncbi:MAG: hypothetical protein ABII18_02690 [bacterium]
MSNNTLKAVITFCFFSVLMPASAFAHGVGPSWGEFFGALFMFVILPIIMLATIIFAVISHNKNKNHHKSTNHDALNSINNAKDYFNKNK